MKCLECKQEFTPQRKTARFCKASCRAAHSIRKPLRFTREAFDVEVLARSKALGATMGKIKMQAVYDLLEERTIIVGQTS